MSPISTSRKTISTLYNSNIRIRCRQLWCRGYHYHSIWKIQPAFVNWNGCNYKWVVVWVTQVLHVSNVAGNIFNADCKSCKCKFTQNRSRYSKIQTSTWNNTIKTALSFNGKAIKIVRTVTYRMERLPKKNTKFHYKSRRAGKTFEVK